MDEEKLKIAKQKRDALVQLWDRIDENHKRIINSENTIYEWRVRRIIEELGKLNEEIEQCEKVESPMRR